MNLLSESLKTAPALTAEETADEQAAIGRAALKKQREEATKSLKAVLASEADHGKAVKWERRITTATNADSESGRETRKVAVFERAGAYGERDFLRLANRAAAAAVVGGWSNAEAVESVGAELVVRVLEKTSGRMPKRGSLGRMVGDHENPDAAYLTAMARRVIAEALRGDKGKAGLAAEAFPVAAEDGAETADLADLAAGTIAEAEGEQNPYLADPITPRPGEAGYLPYGHYGPQLETVPTKGDYLTAGTRTAVKRLAVETGRRPAAVSVAIVSALRNTRSADLADAGHGKTAGAIRKAASTGRAILADSVSRLAEPVPCWSAADWRVAEAWAILCEGDTAGRIPSPAMERPGKGAKRAPRPNGPTDRQAAAMRRVYFDGRPGDRADHYPMPTTARTLSHYERQAEQWAADLATARRRGLED